MGSSDNSISSGFSTPESVAAAFREQGGVFLTSPTDLAFRLTGVRALVLDWDGVFNPGTKGDGSTSTFSEADSMGLNLLRFGLWRRDGRVPPIAIVTGEQNASARVFAARENLHALYQGVKDKSAALADFCAGEGLQRSEVVCVFDDVNDLAMARGCGLRILVRRAASPLLRRYVEDFQLADYVTGMDPGRYALRELCEMLLGLMDVFAAVVRSRVELDREYTAYWSAREAIRPRLVQR